MKKRVLFSLILFILVITSSSAFAAAKPLTLRLGHMSPLDSPFNYFAAEFKRLIEARSQKTILIDIYPASQLGSDRELLEGIQIGTIDMVVNTSSAMTNFVKIYGVLDLPHMFKTWKQAYDWLASPASDNLFAESYASGIHTLSMMPRGFRHTFNNVRPIKTVADMKGLKLRVVESSVYSDSFKVFGTNPQQMAWGEVYTALQQNTIDGMENSYVTVHDYKMHEIQKYGSETSHMFAFAALNIRDKVFKGFSADKQKLLVQCAKEAAKTIGYNQEKEEQEFKGKVQAGGVKINTVNINDFSALVQPVYDSFISRMGKKHLQAIQALER